MADILERKLVMQYVCLAKHADLAPLTVIRQLGQLAAATGSNLNAVKEKMTQMQHNAVEA